MASSDRTTRRSFLKGAAAAAGATLVASMPGCATPQRTGGPVAGRAAKRDKLRVAFIGTGGIGGYHLEETTKLGSVVCPCFCDVDVKRYGKYVEQFPDARRYQDYRKMLEKEENNFDAVMIGIPDHQHYPATILAMRLGKHVYTQKPLTHTVWEARQLTEAAKKYKVATQMGNQGHAMEGWRLVYEWIHGGAIGHVRETHTWTNRPIWPQGMPRPEGSDPVPENLDWDVWLGPAPQRPYKEGAYHPFVWRGWWDFGAGALGDMACHTWDGVFGTLDPGSPTSVEPVAATPVTDEAFPNVALLKFQFPGRLGRPAFTAYWYDGSLRPPRPRELEADRHMPDTGNLFIGSKGSILIAGDYCESPRIIPEKKMKEIGKPRQMLERSPGHVKEWVLAAMGEEPLDFPKSNFSYSGPFTESVLLGNIALRVGQRIDWDGRQMKFTNLPEANRLVSKEYRDGWKF